jgi:FixJ family two-component response regulator
MQVRTFTSAREFLDAPRDDRPGCLLVDVRMPGLSGLDLQQALRSANIDLPIVFMTGHGDIPMSVRAMKAGAVDFLPKPVNDQDLLDAVGQALDRSVQSRRTHQELAEVRQRIELLSPRERQVMELVVAGKLTDYVEQLIERLDLDYIRFVLRVARATRDRSVKDELHHLKLPTLLVWGRNDQVTPPPVAEEFASLIEGAELKFIDKCGHAPNLEKPAAMTRMLREFLPRCFADDVPRRTRRRQEAGGSCLTTAIEAVPSRW